MLQWPHSGFHVHAGVPGDDRAFALRLARCCARNPVALERMTYDAEVEQVTYRSDRAAGPTAGTATVDPLEFLARLVTHIPEPGRVMQRYYGWYASRTGARGGGRRATRPRRRSRSSSRWTGRSAQPDSAGRSCSAASSRSIRSPVPGARD